MIWHTNSSSSCWAGKSNTSRWRTLFDLTKSNILLHIKKNWTNNISSRTYYYMKAQSFPYHENICTSALSWNAIRQTNKHAHSSAAAQAFPIRWCPFMRAGVQNLLRWIMFMYESSREKPPFGESINFSSEMIQKAPMENCVVVAAPS